MARNIAETWREEKFKKKAGCVLPTLEAVAVGGYWLIGDIVGKSSFPGKSESFTSHFSLGGWCLLLSAPPAVHAVNTAEESFVCTVS